MKRRFALLSAACLLAAGPAVASDPWADSVVSYTAGSNVASVFGTNPPVLFDDASAALGSPTRDSVAFGGYPVTPFSQPGDTSEVVSIGAGGSLTVEFDEPVTDDPRNPFGIDLLIFGNTFFTTNDFGFGPTNFVDGDNGEPGVVELSSDGVNFVTATGVFADTRFPTNGYADTTDFFSSPAGVLSDFTKPVDPAFNPDGLGPAAVVAGYDGSGGGTGVDLADFGLASVSFVRISNPAGTAFSTEIDALADVSPVPEPAALAVVAMGLSAVLLKARRA